MGLYGHTETNVDGRFILAVPANQRYVVHAFRDRFRVDERGETECFIEHAKSLPVSGGDELRFTLKRAP